MCWIADNVFKMSEKNPTFYAIKAYRINSELLFTTRLGSSGTSLDNLAWRAFVLAAAGSKNKKYDKLREIHLYNWIDASAFDIDSLTSEQLEKFHSCKYKYKKAATKWLKSAGVEGEFVRK